MWPFKRKTVEPRVGDPGHAAHMAGLICKAANDWKHARSTVETYRSMAASCRDQAVEYDERADLAEKEEARLLAEVERIRAGKVSP